jgi:hypothetical protein
MVTWHPGFLIQSNHPLTENCFQINVPNTFLVFIYTPRRHEQGTEKLASVINEYHLSCMRQKI